MKKILTSILAVVLLCWGAVAQQLLPSSNGEIIKHKYYTLSYSEKDEQAEWVYYILNPEMVGGTASRKDNFRPDPKVSTGSATLADYKASGYDRGHLCPAASMSINDEAMSESFYLSNMSPQFPSFNRGGWKRLESNVREWAVSEGEIHVVTGTILSDPLGVIGENKVTVPRAYFKAIYSPKRSKMVGYIMPNIKIDKPIESYAVSVDSIEKVTGIDLFMGLDDELENRLESCVNSSF
ncbi:MAG: DNA/RNA non-specific endonuclease [Rikenellaceae bacterium]